VAVVESFLEVGSCLLNIADATEIAGEHVVEEPPGAKGVCGLAEDLASFGVAV